MKLMEFIVEKDDDLPDGLLADKAINELTKLKKRKKPFFMGLGFLNLIFHLLPQRMIGKLLKK